MGTPAATIAYYSFFRKIRQKVKNQDIVNSLLL
jgi:hypothetical protein